MKKMTKTKAGFLGQHAKYFLSVKFIIVAVVLAGLSAGAGAYKVVWGTNAVDFNKQTASILEEKSDISESIISSAPETPIALASSSASVVDSLNLSNNIGVYVYSKKTGPCKDYSNTVMSKQFSMRCKTANALWRGQWTKKIDTAGYSKLRVKASLDVNEYTNYFSECGYKGTNRDDFVDLIALSSDPEPTLNAECNHVVPEKEWSKCFIKNTDPAAITHCGIPKCSSSKSCDLEIDINGREAIYLLFSVSDSWLADVEGVLSNAEITLTK